MMTAHSQRNVEIRNVLTLVIIFLVVIKLFARQKTILAFATVPKACKETQ